jgi:hypothetical protein
LANRAALVVLLRGFDLKWLMYDPDAPRSLRQGISGTIREPRGLTANAKLLVLVAALTEECKKWHPEIPDVEIALPHFIQWFRRNTTE